MVNTDDNGVGEQAGKAMPQNLFIVVVHNNKMVCCYEVANVIILVYKGIYNTFLRYHLVWICLLPNLTL